MDDELELFNVLKQEQELRIDEFNDMTIAFAVVLPDLTSEETLRYDDLLDRFTEFGSRSLRAQADFERLWNESKTHEEQQQATARAAAAFERDIEELKGFERELLEIMRPYQRGV